MASSGRSVGRVDARGTDDRGGVGDLGIQARRGQETGIECSTAIEESLAFVAERPIHEPAHDNRRIGNEPRSRHGGLWLPVTGVARFDKFLDGIGQLREVDTPSANPVMDGRHALPRAAHLSGVSDPGTSSGLEGRVYDVSILFVSCI
jgi:hypothetical protein